MPPKGTRLLRWGAPLATTLNCPPHDTDLSLSLATVCLLSGASSVCLGLSLFHGFVVAGIGCIGHISVRPVPGLSRPPGHPQVRRGRSVQQLLGGFVFMRRVASVCTTLLFLGSIRVSFLFFAGGGAVFLFCFDCWLGSLSLLGWSIISRTTTPVHSIMDGCPPGDAAIARPGKSRAEGSPRSSEFGTQLLVSKFHRGALSNPP